MTYMSWLSMHALAVLKAFHDRNRGSALFEEYENRVIDDDAYYDIVVDAIESIFAFTHREYNEKKEFETWVFIDPIIKEFVQLCGKYEKQHNLTEVENPFRGAMLSTLHKGLEYCSYAYDYGWCLSDTERGQKRLLLFQGPEFMIDHHVVRGLLDIYDGFHKQVALLKDALKTERPNNIIPFPAVYSDVQEAA